MLNELAGLAQVAQAAGIRGRRRRTRVAAILDEAAKFATNVLDPLNGRRRSRGLDTGCADGTRRRRRRASRTPICNSCENGWNGLTKNPEFGGQGCRNSSRRRSRKCGIPSNMAFDLCPLLTQGAIEAIELCAHAGAEGDVPAEDGRRQRGPAR